MEPTQYLNPTAQYRHYGVNSHPRQVSDGRSSLTIKDLNYQVDDIKGYWWQKSWFEVKIKKTVLKNVNMYFTSGQLAAITGSSGSGKTSLLDVISGRAEGEVDGNVYVNNTICSEKSMRSRSCYVMQADRLLPNLTVRETLRYTAFLKLPGKTTHKQVDKVIQDLGLKSVADSLIGATINRGISGGERRRVTIAVQLLQDPQIILLDEPTTGLDSFTARYVVNNLRDLAHSGKIVIMSVHQPRYDILKLFDQVAILSQGEVTYYGPQSEMVPYFTSINYPCPTYANPMDIYIDVSSIDRRSPEREVSCSLRVTNLVTKYRHSDQYLSMMDNISRGTSDVTKPSYISTSGPGIGRILYTLTSRFYVNLWRDKMMFGARIGNFPLFSIFIVMFLGTMTYDQQSIQDRTGLLYNSVSSPPFIAIINCVQIFPPLRDVYYRECRDGLYNVVLFILAYTLHILPFIILSSFAFASCLYWICGLQNDVTLFLMFAAVITMMHITGEFVTVLILGLCHNPQIANTIASLFTSLSCLISSGLIRSYESLPYVLKLVATVSLPKYAAEIVVGNEFHNLNFTCVKVLFILFSDEPCGYQTGEAFLDVFYPGAFGHVSRNFEIMIGYFFFIFIMSMVSFKIRGFPTLQ
ncbi:hypothetical protein LOTGIDRAFT_128295 [Lottia gigantea]|uniref:ABC transporter domain-containing protein n=1 Tax=Lottia gigantea TaxID=225164 RepID=V3Z7D8_LOTGI|nr:hypothetical protein LOTGIDRAFT_128295 [Lottia gigantea]ESO86758.1 hypothetical protein LOTGIDRAFT_128295 [Lottia gigantea]